MRPISTILAFQLMSIVSGYLFAEGCVSIRYGHRGQDAHTAPLITTFATRYCWLILLLSVGWAVYALHAERTFVRRATRELIPLGLGVFGAVFLFFFFILAGVVTLVQPVHLHG